ncbi:MAG TPA: WG repeat-containing protein, partial [Thermoanaerobaculia bacterium]|nr:WG repeat-containing protein [Thermoanaerobaculia bacterium]
MNRVRLPLVLALLTLLATACGDGGIADNRGGGAGSGDVEAPEGIYPVRMDGQVGFIDGTGDLVVEAQYGYTLEPSEGLMAVATMREEWGFLSVDSLEWAVEPQFNNVSPFADGLAAADFGGRAGYIDETGETVIEARFEAARRLSEGLAAVKEGGRWGWVDPAGEMAIPARYAATRDFSGGLAAVAQDELF